MKHGLTLLIALFCWTAAALPAQAASASELKARMQERQPALEKLWVDGAIGVDNLGLYSPRGSLSSNQKKLVQQENTDRKAVYALIAKQTGKTSDQVGAQRALQIAKGASPGLWLQNPQGDWYKK
ncbi:MAG: DUF1318 domain-containing protein [Verrucomicrobiota bacterium]